MVALWIVLPAVLWAGSSRTETKPVSSAAELSTIRGVVKATSQAMLASQVQGRISHLPFKEGQRFKKGAIVVSLDCGKYEAELASAAAEYRAKQKTYANNLRMAKHQAVGHLEVEVSQAEAQKAEAMVRAAQVNVSGCVIRAPFGGRVVKVVVNEHENVFPNDQLLSLLDDSRLEIELIIPSRALAWLKVGTPFSYDVDETGHRYTASIQEIGASVDPASQTIRVIGAFEKTPPDILAGMSGSATFEAVVH